MKMQKTIVMTVMMALICAGFTWRMTASLFPQTVVTSPEEIRNRVRWNGQRLMAMKKIPHGDEQLAGSNWTVPERIRVGDVVYTIATNNHETARGTFDICSADSPEVTMGKGEYEILGNAKEARITGFSRCASSSMPLQLIAKSILVIPFDVNTNALYVSFAGKVTSGSIVYKNLFLNIRYTSVSNAYEIAGALLNAGLPESERVEIPSGP